MRFKYQAGDCALEASSLATFLAFIPLYIQFERFLISGEGETRTTYLSYVARKKIRVGSATATPWLRGWRTSISDPTNWAKTAHTNANNSGTASRKSLSPSFILRFLNILGDENIKINPQKWTESKQYWFSEQNNPLTTNLVKITSPISHQLLPSDPQSSPLCLVIRYEKILSLWIRVLEKISLKSTQHHM